MSNIIMQHIKSTKGTEVYSAKPGLSPTGMPPAIESLYIKKWAFTGPVPAEIEVSFRARGPEGG